jgi:hypothetical protein
MRERINFNEVHTEETFLNCFLFDWNLKRLRQTQLLWLIKALLYRTAYFLMNDHLKDHVPLFGLRRLIWRVIIFMILIFQHCTFNNYNLQE